MSSHDPSDRPGKGRKLVLRKIEKPGGSITFPGGGRTPADPSQPATQAALPPSPVSSDSVPTVRRPVVGPVSALTASAAAAGHTPMPGPPPAETREPSVSQTQVSFPPVVAASEHPIALAPSRPVASSTRAVVPRCILLDSRSSLGWSSLHGSARASRTSAAGGRCQPCRR